MNAGNLQTQHVINASYTQDGTVLQQLSLDPFSDGPFRDDSIHLYPWVVVFFDTSGKQKRKGKKTVELPKAS